MKVLVSGFDPFGGEGLNPAWEALKLLSDDMVGVELLRVQVPTVFGKSFEVLLEAINEHRPDVVLCVGQAGGRFDITIERVAINIDDARIADNIGCQPVDRVICEDGDSAYFSNLPIKAIVSKIREGGLPASVSNTAGTFVCNHIMYLLLHGIFKGGIVKRGGFMHVPYVTSQVVERSGQPSMSVSDIARGVGLAIEAIRDNDKDIRVSYGLEH